MLLYYHNHIINIYPLYPLKTVICEGVSEYDVRIAMAHPKKEKWFYKDKPNKHGGRFLILVGDSARRTLAKRHMKKSTKKLFKLKCLDSWEIPNRDKMGRRV